MARTKAVTVVEVKLDDRDRDPLFETYRQRWLYEINSTPRMAMYPPEVRESYAAQMARSSVRFDTAAR